MKKHPNLSIIIPAKNEALNLGDLLDQITSIYPDAEIIVVNDGSEDNTEALALAKGATVINHPYSQGNGAAVKSGVRHAQGEILVLMDGDGQHDPQDIPALLQKLGNEYDMVVGARHTKTHASFVRKWGNLFYNKFASFMTGHKIEDLTSGFRAVRTKKFKKFLYLLPNGFSYPTTSTMAFFRSGFPVAYVPIHAGKREGESHIRLVKDGIRFFIIIIKIGTLFSPMRLFLPISFLLASLGLGYYGYTYFTVERFTNMSALLFTSSIITFLIGIVSEQISSLHYKNIE